MNYLLDTNTISDWMERLPAVTHHLEEAVIRKHVLGICQPVYYELQCGLIWRKAEVKLKNLREQIMPQLEWVYLKDEDWLQAALFWADSVRKGRQIEDPDLLLAALAYRLDAVIVSSDNDFDALPVKRENWRE